MNAAVHAWFDDSLNQTIRELEHEILLHSSGGQRGCGLRPHITLTATLDLDVQAFTDALGACPIISAPIPVEFDSFGSFPKPVSAVFLNPVPTEALLDLHRSVSQILEDLGSTPANAHYLRDRWTPHCALASAITPKDFSGVLTGLLGVRRPLTGQITHIGVVELPQDLEIMNLPLGT